MTRLGKFTLGCGLCAAVFIYLVGDLHFYHGPLWRALAPAPAAAPVAVPETAAADRAAGVVARVAGQPIHRGQWERAVHEQLWFDGAAPQDLSPEALQAVRRTALEDLIDHELLRQRVAVDGEKIEVSDAEVAERLVRFKARFESEADWAAALANQGLGDECGMRTRLAARIRQEKWMERRIAPQIQVTEAEARQWHEEHRDQWLIPERVAARHVFLPTLEQDPAVVKARLENALADLSAGRKDFAALARELSDDATTRGRGGDLGWMTRSRLPADLATPLFAMPLNKPRLVRTKLGWHLLEVTARKPAEPRAFGSARVEIIAALEAAKRQRAVAELRRTLRRDQAGRITVYQEMSEP